MLSPRCDRAAEKATVMSIYRSTLLASAVIAALGCLVGTQPARAGGLDFLNHMNPEYTKCISNVHAQLLPQYRNDAKINDAAVTACNNAHPAFGRNADPQRRPREPAGPTRGLVGARLPCINVMQVTSQFS
jgi:hypothetical protein